MKKKIVAMILICALVMGLTACGEPKKVDIAFITAFGSIDDKSFNQFAWEGAVAFGKSADKNCKHYEVGEKTEKGHAQAIKQAVEDGAKVIIAQGTTFETAIFTAQEKYPKNSFIMIDGMPNNGDENNPVKKIGINTVSIQFAEEQAGYLAGYGVVKDGYTKLGFIGGMIIPPVSEYGYGFIQGAGAAAKEMKWKAPVEINFTYMGNFDESKKAESIAKAWYNDGTEVIFSCGGLIINSVMKVADKMDKAVIGVDVDQSYLSDKVITSATKSVGEALNGMLYLYYKNKFPGGKTVVLDAESNGVGLPMKTSKLANFKAKDYDKIYKEMAEGKIEILKDGINTVKELSTDFVKVTVMKTDKK